jgi:hypothetical protein
MTEFAARGRFRARQGAWNRLPCLAECLRLSQVEFVGGPGQAFRMSRRWRRDRSGF